MQDPYRQLLVRHHRRSHGLSRMARRYLPFWWRRALLTPYLLAQDGLDLILGRRGELVPPRYLDFAGNWRFIQAGQQHLKYFKELCGLQPHHRVLDVGCGIGRMAVALSGYLTTGSYAGFDVAPSGIRWCQRHITPRFPQFHFQIADIYNKQYNPRCGLQARDYHFPFSDEEFDIVILISVFTHMLPPDVEHYISEISRVLRPGANCIFSAFLLDDQARARMASGQTAYNFDYELPGCWTVDPVTPETTIAYEESAIISLLLRHSLVPEPTHFGAWSGRSDYLDYGDIVCATKTLLVR